MVKKVFRYVFGIVFVFSMVYILFFVMLPSKISVIRGNNAELDTFLPVSISAIKKTEGEIEYDFSSYDTGEYEAYVSFAGMPIKKVTLNVLPDAVLVPCGKVEGIVLDYDGMLVLGTGKIETGEGRSVSPSKGMIKTGDIIKKINGEEAESRQQVAEIVESCNGEKIELQIKRNNEYLDVEVVPVLSAVDKKYKLGCWIRSETQGLGTITYIDKKTGKFGALGHGVYDADAKKLLEIENGILTEAFVNGIKKGEKGIPGEISGMLNKQVMLGNIEKNTPCGVYGVIDKVSEFEYMEMPVAASSEIETGEAFILNNAINGTVNKYKIEIESVGGMNKEADKSMVIKITDEKLLENTGGIVQGMSGSPILQNGRIVGAVTHVFVNDPTRGYGIFIENMLEAAI